MNKGRLAQDIRRLCVEGEYVNPRSLDEYTDDEVIHSTSCEVINKAQLPEMIEFVVDTNDFFRLIHSLKEIKATGKITQLVFRNKNKQEKHIFVNVPEETRETLLTEAAFLSKGSHTD